MFHQCQLVGKPNQIIPLAPLIPIPVTKEPFKEILLDIVGLSLKLSQAIVTCLLSRTVHPGILKLYHSGV